MTSRIIDGNMKNMVGKKVREFRKKKGWSEQQLSIKLETEAVYICRGSISRIENQTRTVTDIELYGLSKVFSIPIQDFLNSFIK